MWHVHIRKMQNLQITLVLCFNRKVFSFNFISVCFILTHFTELNEMLSSLNFKSFYNSTKTQSEKSYVLYGWLLGFYDSTRDKDDTTVGVGHSRRYCNTGYDQSQGRRPSTLKCIGPISKGDIEPNHPSEINPNSDSRSRSDGRSRRFVQYRVDQSQGQRPRSLLSTSDSLLLYVLYSNIMVWNVSRLLEKMVSKANV